MYKITLKNVGPNMLNLEADVIADTVLDAKWNGVDWVSKLLGQRVQFDTVEEMGEYAVKLGGATVGAVSIERIR